MPINNEELGTNEFKIRPYARLLVMLGDQLIKNEIVALTELIKNSYDANADECRIDFVDVSETYDISDKSKIIISDDGFGMSKNTLTTHFLNPATPIKKNDENLKVKLRKGRVSQGEKGVGRFSMLKLGKRITVYTKEQNDDTIHRIELNFDEFDDEMLSKNGKATVMFLDELSVEYSNVEKQELPQDSLIREKNKGTTIVINSLKGKWGSKQIQELKGELVKFTPFRMESDSSNSNDVGVALQNIDFSIKIYRNGKEDPFLDSSLQKIQNIIKDKALYKITGRYIENTGRIRFTYSEANRKNNSITVSLSNPAEGKNEFQDAIKGLTIYKKEVSEFYKNNSHTVCGSFSFKYYIFDFSANGADDYGLKKEEKDAIRDYCVFLYRDGIRVQPYGTPGDDWLQIDRKRANTRASEMFSNDQIIGQIDITKRGNPNLKDKTSREGIIEDGDAFKQLTTINRMILSLIRTKLYQNYKERIKQKKEIENEKNRIVEIERFKELNRVLKDDETAIKHLNNLEKAFNYQKEAYQKRINIVESLAGVGLSVEASSHDIMLTISRLKDTFYALKREILSKTQMSNKCQKTIENLNRSEEMLALIEMKMRDLQTLFVSSKQRAKITRIEPLVNKIRNIYEKPYADNKILVEYRHIGKSPVCAKLIDAVIYQVFINLFDNSLYWLQLVDSERKVIITFDGDQQQILFSDTGIGVHESDAPYIFEEFYSGKGEEGRGLGLYIAKRLLNRYYYNIELILNDKEKVAKGANFKISFITDEEIIS